MGGGGQHDGQLAHRAPRAQRQSALDSVAIMIQLKSVILERALPISIVKDKLFGQLLNRRSSLKRPHPLAPRPLSFRLALPLSARHVLSLRLVLARTLCRRCVVQAFPLRRAPRPSLPVRGRADVGCPWLPLPPLPSHPALLLPWPGTRLPLLLARQTSSCARSRSSSRSSRSCSSSTPRSSSTSVRRLPASP